MPDATNESKDQTKDEMTIFSFAGLDGKPMFRDPMVAHRKLIQSLGSEDLNTKLNSFESTAPSVSFEAAELLARAARDAFNLPPFNEETGEGWVESKAIGVLYEYLDYASKKNSNTDPNPNSSDATDTHQDTN